VPSNRTALSLVGKEVTTPAIVAALPQMLDEVRAAADRRGQQTMFRSALAALVFAYWSHLFNHKRARLDVKRNRLIQARLAECEDDVSEILWALDAAAKDEWVRGTAPNARHPNDSLEYLLRDLGQVERWGERSPGWRDGRVHPLAKKHLGDLTSREGAA